MGQVMSGIRGILAIPAVYSAFQNIMGAHRFRADFVKEFVRPFTGCAVLDIGCGPADILAHLPNVSYWGFDVSDAYIARAQARFGDRGVFYCRELTSPDVDRLPKVDIVMALGLLHHLDDDSALSVLRLASRALKPGGRLVTFDPCFDPGQTAISRLLVGLDRGQDVRTRAEYESIAGAVFDSPRVVVRHRLWIPYTHCIMECTKA